MDKNQYILKLKKLKSIVDKQLTESSQFELDKLSKQYSNLASKFLDDIQDFFTNPSNEEKFLREMDRVFNKEVAKLLKFMGHNYIDSIKAYAKGTLDSDNFASFKIYMNILRKAGDVLAKDISGVVKVNYQAIRGGFILIGCAIICIALAIASTIEKIRLNEFTDAIKNLDVKKLIYIFLKISYLGFCAFLGGVGLCYIVIAVKNFDLREEKFSEYVEIFYNSFIVKGLRKLISFGITLLNELMKLSISVGASVHGA
jgi:hypothetical protein